mmetsp:Transcript_31473/g.41680  ORF Transcript_31473/g.41680 Transcript_31473/m.41680 type:complete len:177 (+) Transcript_31473:163-693(+)
MGARQMADLRKQKQDEEMNRKTQEALDFDHEEETSYEGRFMYVKAFVFTSFFVFCCYHLNVNMLYKLQKRHARNEGVLDEFLQHEEEQKKRGLIRRTLGKIGGGEDEGIDGGIKNTSLGGHWKLRTLDGRPFSSHDLAGRYYLIFFGSTLCPDVCPFTLRTLMRAIKILKNTSEGK